MSHMPEPSATDPLAIPSEEAPRTVEYLMWLRQEGGRVKWTDLAHYFALMDRGVKLSEEMNELEHLGNFLKRRAWVFFVNDDKTSYLEDLRELENLVERMPVEVAESFRMELDHEFGDIHRNEENATESRRRYLAGLERARQIGDRNYQAHFHLNLATVFGNLLGDMQGALDHLIAALRLCGHTERVESEVVPTMSYDNLADLTLGQRKNVEPGLLPTVLFDLAKLSYDCEDYETARAYTEEALSIKGPSFEASHSPLAMMSSICAANGDLDEALRWADRAVEAVRGQSSIMSTINAGALSRMLVHRGELYFDRGDYRSAIQDLDEALSYARSDTDVCRTRVMLACSWAALAAEAEARRPGTSSAIPARTRAIEQMAAAEPLLEGVVPLFQFRCLYGISKARELLGEFEQALRAVRRGDRLKHEMFIGKVRNEIGSLRLLMKLEREEHEKAIERMRAEQTERELGNATLHLLAQTELLADLRNDLLKIARKIPPTEPAARELRDRLKRLPCESVDWEKYDWQFQSVHPEFIRKLTERAPDLTPTEVRICTMLRMNLKSHEMARIFCISEAGVEFHRTRIRRKLKLSREEKLPLVLGAM